MNKGIITLLAGIFGTVGAYVPIMLGWDPSGLNGLSILGALIGGGLGIFLGVKFQS